MHIRAIGSLVLFLAVLGPAVGHAEGGLLDEAKLGLMTHDIPFGGDRKESGVDVNGELLFVSPDLLAPIWAPRPHLGISINSAGGNSYAYAGLTWTASLPYNFFAGLGLGGAVHNGPDSSSSQYHKGLGTRALFHESLEFGYRITPAHNVSLFLDHISNANIGVHNPGITNLGVRTGFAF